MGCWTSRSLGTVLDPHEFAISGFWSVFGSGEKIEEGADEAEAFRWILAESGLTHPVTVGLDR